MKRLKVTDVSIRESKNWNYIQFDWPEYDTTLWPDKEFEMIRWCEELKSDGRFIFDETYGSLFIENEDDTLLVTIKWQ